ncbi:mannose-6-phosphate isomerase, type 1 [Deinococcus reticulitermitis]|uniref:Mannose-6-phosphate isomerase, type 1 n=1 Tax=Deinococcus reticulitermitis TaxID=856736 RepID=A0A1H6ZNM1_9DEIO|nr:type I phosphomannose isomerase catalytic subunit [Deinococcus reticulitermitis]SEJ55019.1 mannose-6-phosphate isomerase, type 1 [Deinococcus reticulitermitis]
MSPLPAFLPLTPRYHARVWGGEKLAPPQGGTPIGEAWVADGESVVSAGPCAGRTVNELLRQDARALLGTRAADEATFPLLIKLLDCHDWLSVQVHPDDAQARELVGPGERGKTEAWHILEAQPGSELIAGVKEGTGAGELHAAIRAGRVLDVSRRHQVEVGDTVYIPAGTLHALGPGLLLYEVQQASDTTYRVYDWDRPASAGRALHLEESVRVIDPALSGDLRRGAETGRRGELVRSPYFTLWGAEGGEPLDTAGQSCHVVTALGHLVLTCGPERLELTPHATALVPAGTGRHALEGSGRALVARIAGEEDPSPLPASL